MSGDDRFDEGADDDAGWGPWPSDDDEVLGEEVGDDTGPLHSSERVERGVEALQAAARELIRAARTVLDAAEGVVDDPDAVVHLVGSFADLARNALRTDWVGGAGRRPPGAGDDPEPPDDVEHIHVD
jgi:hypothetical protein